jgi:hypothetical protein
VIFADIEFKEHFPYDIQQAMGEDSQPIGPLFYEKDGAVEHIKLIEGEAQAFDRNSTLFLITEVKKRIEVLHDSAKPKSIAELKERITKRKGKSRMMWVEIATELLRPLRWCLILTKFGESGRHLQMAINVSLTISKKLDQQERNSNLLKRWMSYLEAAMIFDLL